MGDVEDSVAALAEAAKRLEVASRNFATPANSNQSTVTLQAGGFGVWLACTCCAVMLACNVFLAGAMFYKFNEYDNRLSSAEDYIHAAYMNRGQGAPEKKETKK